MRETTYEAGHGAAQGFSVGAWAGTLTPEPHQDTGAMAAAGQLWSTVGDLARFAAFLVTPDETVLSQASVAEMGVPRTGTPDGGRTVSYGLGTRLIVTSAGRWLLGHTGSMPGFLAGLFVDREEGTAAICLANTTYGLRVEGLPVEMLEILDDAEPALPEAWRPTRQVPDEVQDILGVWFWGERALEMHLVGAALELRDPDMGASMSYRRTDTDTYVGLSGYHTGETLRAVRSAGVVTHLECATFIYTRTPYDPAAPIPGGHPRH
jgi:CubicO group peptidase (beta-lactamase class C family)